LVGAQGVRLLENASIFCVRCIAAAAFLVLRKQRVKGDPTGALAPRRLPRPPAESEPPERKPTGVFKRNATSYSRSAKYALFFHYKTQ